MSSEVMEIWLLRHHASHESFLHAVQSINFWKRSSIWDTLESFFMQIPSSEMERLVSKERCRNESPASQWPVMGSDFLPVTVLSVQAVCVRQEIVF